MTSPRTTAAVALLLLVGCQNPDEPVPLYDGEWIDIAGVGHTADDTCVGTFEYVDAYAGVLAAEFGVDMPLGTFIWYTREEFDALLPCGADKPYPTSCADDAQAHSAFLANTHEIVHVANHHTGLCPGPLAEGLAVYYSAFMSDGNEMDFEVLANHFAAPTGPIYWYDYEMLGRFAAFLVDEYGLAAVLDVCAMAGRNATGAQLSETMQTVLGATPDELVAALSEQPSSCNDFRTYRSKVFTCGVKAAAEDLGTVEEELFASMEFGCDRPGTVSALLTDEIQRTTTFDISTPGTYFVDVRDESTDSAPPGIQVEISRCGTCEGWHRNVSDATLQFPMVVSLDAGRHALEITLPDSYSGTLRLWIDR